MCWLLLLPCSGPTAWRVGGHGWPTIVRVSGALLVCMTTKIHTSRSSPTLANSKSSLCVCHFFREPFLISIRFKNRRVQLAGPWPLVILSINTSFLRPTRATWDCVP